MSTTVPPREVPPSRAVVEVVARREGVDPTNLDVPLFDAIDPDALNGCIRSLDDSNSDASVEFSYYGYHLTVTADGTVRVDSTE